MFDVGFTEMLLIGVVALVVIGPERLPAVARTIGQYVGKLQRFVTGVKRDIRSELESGELKELLGDQKQQIDELRKMVNTTRKDLETGTREVVGDARRTFATLESSAKGADAQVPEATPVSLAKSPDASPAEADAAPSPGASRAGASMPTTDRVPGAPPAPAATSAPAASGSDAHPDAH